MAPWFFSPTWPVSFFESYLRGGVVESIRPGPSGITLPSLALDWVVPGAHAAEELGADGEHVPPHRLVDACLTVASIAFTLPPALQPLVQQK